MGIIGSFWNQALCWNKRGENKNIAQNLVLLVALSVFTSSESDSTVLEAVIIDSVINNLFWGGGGGGGGGGCVTATLHLMPLFIMEYTCSS